MFVKVVSSYITNDVSEHTSITQNKYALVYRVGEWTEPRLKGSRLFVYESVFAALAIHKRPVIRELPYTGITFWTVNVLDARKIVPIKDPTNRVVELFWKLYNLGEKPAFSDQIPKVYKYFSNSQPVGVYVAKEVRLIEMVEEEQFEKLHLSAWLDR